MEDDFTKKFTTSTSWNNEALWLIKKIYYGANKGVPNEEVIRVLGKNGLQAAELSLKKSKLILVTDRKLLEIKKNFCFYLPQYVAINTGIHLPPVGCCSRSVITKRLEAKAAECHETDDNSITANQISPKYTPPTVRAIEATNSQDTNVDPLLPYYRVPYTYTPQDYLLDLESCDLAENNITELYNDFPFKEQTAPSLSIDNFFVNI